MNPEALIEIAYRTARNGNTTAAARVAAELGAQLVVLNAEEVKRLGFGVSVERDATALMGTAGPYVVDISVVGAAGQEWQRDRRALNIARRTADDLQATILRLVEETMRLADDRDEALAEVARLRAALLAAYEAAPTPRSTP